MDGATVVGLFAVMQGITIFAVKVVVNSSLKRLEKTLEQEKDERVDEDNELWKAVNKHGHKGLDKNGARVTR